MTLTIDSLARIYRQNECYELRDPLKRSLDFLIHFVHPDGSVGGCYGSCGNSFVSPYGVELLSDVFPAAAAVAQLCRRNFADFHDLYKVIA